MSAWPWKAARESSPTLSSRSMSACVRRASAPVRFSPSSSKRSPASAFLYNPNIALSQDAKPRTVSCIDASDTPRTQNNSKLRASPV